MWAKIQVTSSKGEVTGDRNLSACTLHSKLPMNRFQSSWFQSPPGRTKSEIPVLNNPPPPRAYKIDFNHPPSLWWLTGLQFWWWWLTVKVGKTHRHCCQFYSQWHNFYSQWRNLQALSCVYLLSFVTNCKSYANDCKSDNSTCKFCQPLQLRLTAIELTVTRGGAYENGRVGELKTLHR